MKTTYIHVTDAPRILNGGDTLDGECFIAGGALYGRVLFADPPTLVLATGPSVTIRNCVLDSTFGAAISVSF
jgi:hypothetical protein